MPVAIVWPLATIIIVSKIAAELGKTRTASGSDAGDESAPGITLRQIKFAIVALFGNAINPRVLLNCSSADKIFIYFYWLIGISSLRLEVNASHFARQVIIGEIIMVNVK